MESVRFVGMDVHKDTIDLAVLGGHGGQVDFERRVGGTPEAVKKVIRQLKRNHLVVAGYEAGCMGFHLQRSLQQLDVQCVISAPSSIARAPGDRVKTDRRDALTIARLLRNGESDRVHVPTNGDEAVRDFLRCREDLRDELRRYRQRVQGCLLRHGHVYREARNWTLRYRRWLTELVFEEPALGETVQIYYRRVQELEEKLRLMDERIKQIASSEPYREQVARLRCFRGRSGRVSSLRDGGGVHGFPRAGAIRTLQRLQALAGGDY